MAYNREGYAPWSLTRKAGVQSATVDGTIEVPQYIQPVLDTGFVDEKGDWKGTKSSEEQFHTFAKDEAIANGAEIFAPQIASGTIWPLDMTGFNHVQVAIRPSNGGNFAVSAVMGPNDLAYSNLREVNPASKLQGNLGQRDPQDFTELFDDGAQALTADVWNIFMISNNLHGQKLLQFKIVNNSGGESDIETAFMRLV